MGIPILGSNSVSAGYDIDNSFRTGANSSTPTSNAYLKNTLSSAATEETFTVSAWVKLKGQLAHSFYIWSGNQPNSSPYQYSYFRFLDSSGTASQTIHFKGTQDDGTNFDIESNALFRDPSAWYHAVLSVDTTQGTASNRVKIYVNGSQLTSLQTSNYPSQNAGIRSSSNGAMQTIGTWNYENTNYAPNDDGYISEFYFIDGQALDPTYFGETNDNGVWIPKDYTGTYGTHGVRFEFKQTGSGTNSSGIGADTSGNNNHFEVVNSATTDITADTPTNNFATWNPLDPNRANDLSEGNTQYVSPTSAREQIRSTFGLTSGKWYWETKPTTANGGSSVGVLKENVNMTLDDSLGKDDYGWSYDSDGSSRHNNSSTSSGFDTYTTNDIIGVALDLDNHDIYFYKNGTVQNSGTKAFDLDTGELYFPAFGSNSNGSTDQMTANFGNPPYTISGSFPSESDANGYGNFSYEPPSGYYSICTKNLAEYG